MSPMNGFKHCHKLLCAICKTKWTALGHKQLGKAKIKNISQISQAKEV